MTQLTIQLDIATGKDRQVYSSAEISPCGKYRYTLIRIWDMEKPAVLFVMLNPSTADALKDDRTITRCIGFAKSWGYGGLYVCNLFAYRSTDPKELLKVHNPWGDANLWHIRQLVEKVDKIICAWGNAPILKKLGLHKPEELIPYVNPGQLHYLKLTKSGTPWHPLYLKKDLFPRQFPLPI